MGSRQVVLSASAVSLFAAAALILIASGLRHPEDSQTSLMSVFGIKIGALSQLGTGDVAPEFPTGDDEVEWLNTMGSHPPFALRGEPLKLKELQQQGKTVLLHFFDYTSIESLRSIPVVKRIHHHFGSYGVEVISVHSPSDPYAARLVNVAEAVQRLQIKHAVVNDEHGDIKSEFGSKDLLNFFLIDTHNEVTAVYGGAASAIHMEYTICGVLSSQYKRISCPTMDQLRAQEEPEQEKSHVEKAGKAVAGAKAQKQGLDWYWWYGNGGHSNYCRAPTETIFVGHEDGKGSLTSLQQYSSSPDQKQYTDLSNVELGDGNFVLSGDWISHENGMSVARNSESGMANTHMRIRYYGREVYALMGVDRMERDVHMCTSGDKGSAPAGTECLSDDSEDEGLGQCEQLAGANGMYGWCRAAKGLWGSCTPCKPIEDVKIYLKLNGAPLPHQLRGKDVVEDALGRTYVAVREPRVYFLIEEYHSHPRNLELVFADEGVRVHQFDFSANCSPFMPRAS